MQYCMQYAMMNGGIGLKTDFETKMSTVEEAQNC